MGLMDSLARSLGSITIVDDFDDSSSSATFAANKRNSKRPSGPATAPAANGDAARARRAEKSRADREKDRIAEMSAEELRRENKALRHRAQKQEKEVAMYKRYAEHYRERRKESDRERAKLEQQTKDLETIVQNMRESYELELSGLRDQLSQQSASTTSGRNPAANGATPIQIPASTPPGPVTSTGHTNAHDPTLFAASTTAKVDREPPTPTPTTKGQVPVASTTAAPTAAAARSHTPTSKQHTYSHADVLQLRKQLHEQAAEIRGLRSLLDTPDELSASELAAGVRGLNDEAAALAARIVGAVRLGHTWDVEQAWAVEAAKPALADCLQILTGPKGVEYADDSTLVRLAVQSYLLLCLGDIFNSFMLVLDAKEDRLLCSMYEIISYAEPQSVSARWRVMSRLALTPPPKTFHEAFTRVVKEIKSEMLSGVESILRFAGANYPPGLLMNLIEADSGPMLERLIHDASRLADNLKDKVFSADYRVFVTPQGTSYGHDEMESHDVEAPAPAPTTKSSRKSKVESERDEADDILRNGPNHIGATVIASVGLGLKAVKRMKPKKVTKTSKHGKHRDKEREKEKEKEREREREKDAHSTASTEGERVIEEDIIVKCKVLLSSTVDALRKRAAVS